MVRELQSRRESIDGTSDFFLPPFVETIAAALNEMDDPTDRPGRVDKLVVVGSDSRVAGRLLQIANIAVQPARPLTVIADASAAIGWENMKALALGLAMFSAALEYDDCGRAKPRSGSTLRRLWDHALGCALIGGAIGAAIDSATRYRVFAAGFLHDIGKILLYCDSLDALTKAIKLARENDIPSTEAEILALGKDHVELGAVWSRAAGLDPMLQCAILHHHQPPGNLLDLPEDQLKLAAAVQLADRLCEGHGIGVGGDPGAMVPGLLETLGLRAADCRRELRSVRMTVQGSREAFGFGVMGPAVSPRARMRKRKFDIQNSQPGARSPRVGGRKGRVIPFPARRRASAEGGDKSTDKKLTILVVEDHGSLCDMLSLYFMRYGYHVRTANDGESALAIMDNEEIHLVLLDLMLPRMDGFTVLRQIRKRSGVKPPYVIVVSAGASTKDRTLVLELGANEYMPKPFHLMRLLERIQNVEKYLLN